MTFLMQFLTSFPVRRLLLSWSHMLKNPSAFSFAISSGVCVFGSQCHMLGSEGSSCMTCMSEGHSGGFLGPVPPVGVGVVVSVVDGVVVSVDGGVVESLVGGVVVLVVDGVVVSVVDGVVVSVDDGVVVSVLDGEVVVPVLDGLLALSRSVAALVFTHLY